MLRGPGILLTRATLIACFVAFVFIGHLMNASFIRENPCRGTYYREIMTGDVRCP